MMDTKQKLEFVQLNADDAVLCQCFSDLMYCYIAEMNEHSHRPLPEAYWQRWIDSIIASLGPTDRHLELCRWGETWIGFLYGKVDHEDHKGFIRPGLGYILEFFVKPEFRRRGLGKQMLFRLEALFRQDGAVQMYLTADPVTGKPFWEAVGFENTGVRSPDNQLLIYEKMIQEI